MGVNHPEDLRGLALRRSANRPLDGIGGNARNDEETAMDTTCPQCGSDNTGPSFVTDYDQDDAGRIIARNPFFVCSGCEHTWQVETVMVVARPFDPDDDEAINAFVETVGREVLDAD